MATAETPDSAIPVRDVAARLRSIIGELPQLWVEGEITKVNVHRTSFNVYLTLRDPDADMVLDVRCQLGLWMGLNPPLAEGARVVMRLKPSYYEKAGRITWTANAVQAVGVGEQLARLEALKQRLRSEGLFDNARKRPLPFLPRRIGLITGARSDAQADFIKVTRHRWPAVRIVVRNTMVQGPSAPREVIAALQAFDADPEVDVVVITRGGGSMEDVVLPFSDEALVRAVAEATTPVVTAIGHEQDVPLVDFAADFRASTPSNAAEHVVPDVEAEQHGVADARQRLRRSLARWIGQEQSRLDAIRSRPAMGDPRSLVEGRLDEVAALRDRARRCLHHQLDRAHDEIGHQRARARSLSPLATLQRGYSVLQDDAGHVLTSVGRVQAGQAVAVRVADGRVHATATSTEPLTEPHTAPLTAPVPPEETDGRA